MKRVEFIGRTSGDGACFLWVDVPMNQRAEAVEPHPWEHGQRLDTIYPGSLFDGMGCDAEKTYRFTITVEEIS